MTFESVRRLSCRYDISLHVYMYVLLRSNGSARYRHAGSDSRRPAATITGSLGRESLPDLTTCARQDILNLTLDTLTSLLRRSTCLCRHVTWPDHSASVRPSMRGMSRCSISQFSSTHHRTKRRYYRSRLQRQSILRLSHASAALANRRDGASSFSQEFQRRTHPVPPPNTSTSSIWPTFNVVNRQPHTTTRLLAAKPPGDMSDPSPERRTTPVCPYSTMRVSVQAYLASPAQVLGASGP